MKKIEPYKSISEAISSLDNGGRFYNILTKAEDGIISKGELGKVGGIFNDKQQMILFLELSISKLDAAKRKDIISKLEGSLQDSYVKYKPTELLPSEANSKGEKGVNTILTGIPMVTASRSDFEAFIMTPVIIDNITTFTLIPLFDLYDVYKMRGEQSDANFVIAHAKSKNKLPEEKIKVAGVLKEMWSYKNEKEASKIFLEVVYHMDID